ncbi:MAG: DNA alkylation repair protein [Bacillota bacterium]|nr:DNA alkylation repair protein [Bacillota bacterium]
MTNDQKTIKSELNKYADSEKAGFLLRYFKVFPGGYGEGDLFIGVKVPYQRIIARKYYLEIPLQEVERLLQDPVHECRLTALFILSLRFEKSRTEEDKKEIVDLYLWNLSYVNNWDLVDSSAEKILGPYLMDNKKDLLYELAESGDLWKQRTAMMTTFHFIKNGRFTETLDLAEGFLQHKHDLMHKAVGWMLREIGKRDFSVEYEFLQKHYRKMPRTMLRYAIEKFEPQLREKFLKGLL